MEMRPLLLATWMKQEGKGQIGQLDDEMTDWAAWHEFYH